MSEWLIMLIKKYNVVWIGFAVPDEIAKMAFNLDPIPAIQTHKFGWSFARCLRHAFGEINLISSCPVQNFPLVNKLLFRSQKFSFNKFSGISLFFINIIILKHVSRFLSCIFFMSKPLLSGKFNLIFIHGLHSPYLLFARLSQFFGCKVIVVLTDMPGLILPTDNFIARILKKIDAVIIRFILTNVDAVISLTTSLSDRYTPFKPVLVFPGILDSTLSQCDISPLSFANRQAPFVISYAGGLSKLYGVDRLLDAILLIDSNIKLEIRFYGKGDQVTRIKEVAKFDSRVVYCGYVESNHLFSMLCRSDALINPRPSHESFSQMSFPSKLIEYLSTGRPVLTTRIISIPRDMTELFLYIENEEPEGIKNAIMNLINIPHEELSERGATARDFIVGNYSESVIGNKIRHFVNSFNLEVR
jgi:glycosyltransferase involved in cell wall biosynthesis